MKKLLLLPFLFIIFSCLETQKENRKKNDNESDSKKDLNQQKINKNPNDKEKDLCLSIAREFYLDNQYQKAIDKYEECFEYELGDYESYDSGTSFDRIEKTHHYISKNSTRIIGVADSWSLLSMGICYRDHPSFLYGPRHLQIAMQYFTMVIEHPLAVNYELGVAYSNRGYVKQKLGVVDTGLWTAKSFPYCYDYKRACDLGVENACIQYYSDNCR